MAASNIVIYAALAGNFGVAVTKFIAATVTGSSAMMAESIHSAVDTLNEVLLLVGLHRSKRPIDSTHPFGYGKEQYFWSLIVAVLVFGLGGGISVVQGIEHILEPRPSEDPKWAFIVLGISAILEGASFIVALRAILRKKGDRPFWQYLHRSKDPSTFTVFAEDAAALGGLAFAALGIGGSLYFDMPVLDGMASVAIGILLALVATVLVYESRGLLVGEGVEETTAQAIKDMAETDPNVEIAAWPLTMYLGPENVLLVLSVQFMPAISGEDLANSIDAIESRIRLRYPMIKRIFIEANRLGAAARAQMEAASSPASHG
ncbi:MAG: cation diffusion facilitator family transporter [Herminiimonas sp.]|nr:cation diffusion facilitator family transporter [Herminiimonas sp.]